MVVLLPDLRQIGIPLCLPWQLWKIERFSALEIGDVKSVLRCGANVVGERG